MMITRKTAFRAALIGPLAAAMLAAGILTGCVGNNGIMDGREASAAAPAQEISRGENPGEHGPGGESGGETGGSGSEEAGGATLAPGDTFDAVRGGARLILNYDAAGNSFNGTVENTTGNVLDQVRIEVHLSTGTELGPTPPVDLAPSEVMSVNLPATQEAFTGWIAHAEVGSGAESAQAGGESGGEGGPDGPEGPESGGSNNEAAREAAMSSPITPLDQTWQGVLGGLAVSARYDAATQSVHATVQNTLAQQLCYVQAEPHLKSGTQTVGELGPDQLGNLSQGQQATSSLSVASEPSLAGVAFDGYVVHMEVFDCAGPGPVSDAGGEGSEGSGGEGSGGERGSEEGTGANLTPGETFDQVRGGARLILGYDAPSNSFQGTVVNTTGNVLSQVRVEVHLSNGAELGPTAPVDMAPGEVIAVNLPATQTSFTGWIAHAEVGGGGEGGGEHGSGGASGGEHGSGDGEEHGSGGEHGGNRGSGG